MLAACWLALAALAPALASAAPAPAWTLTATPEPANFAPGKNGEYVLVATNVGGAITSGAEAELELAVPEELKVLTYSAQNSTPGASNPTCTEPAPDEIACKTGQAFGQGRLFIVQAQVEVPPATPAGTLTAQASISGGGAAEAINATAATPIQEASLPFGFLPGFSAPLTEEDGGASLRAGSHPYQQTVSFGFPTEDPGKGLLTNDGHPRNLYVELPRGMVGNPAATPVLCTEAQLSGPDGCPDASQVGMVDVTSLVGEVGINTVLTSNLYNMVPPRGCGGRAWHRRRRRRHLRPRPCRLALR